MAEMRLLMEEIYDSPAGVMETGGAALQPHAPEGHIRTARTGAKM